MTHLRSVKLKRGSQETNADRFPFSVAAIGSLTTLEFSQPVAFLVGENGSGKSTLLEALALAAGLPTVGSVEVDSDATLTAQRRLGDALQLTWGHRRTRRGFFLRAEDFFGFTKTLARMRSDMLAELDEVGAEYAGRSALARGLREGPLRASLADMERRYGIDLDANSHGQSFLRIFQNRFVPGGMYLLDEPEAPLSPQSQLGLLSMIRAMVAQDAQFIIATHSPILLAFPDAEIFSFDETPVRRVAYDELEHVVLTRDFLKEPERYLRHL